MFFELITNIKLVKLIVIIKIPVDKIPNTGTITTETIRAPKQAPIRSAV